MIYYFTDRLTKSQFHCSLYAFIWLSELWYIADPLDLSGENSPEEANNETHGASDNESSGEPNRVSYIPLSTAPKPSFDARTNNGNKPYLLQTTANQSRRAQYTLLRNVAKNSNILISNKSGQRLTRYFFNFPGKLFFFREVK